MFTEAYQHGTTRVSIPDIEALLTVSWCKTVMHIVSGTVTERYTLVGTKKAFYEMYRNSYLSKILAKMVDTEEQANAEVPFADQTRLQKGITVAAAIEDGVTPPQDHGYPRSQSVFWEMLDTQGFKFRRLYQPYECEVCLFGPLLARQLPQVENDIIQLRTQIAALKASNAKADLEKAHALEVKLQDRTDDLRALQNKEVRYSR